VCVRCRASAPRPIGNTIAPVSEAARDWIDENVISKSWQWLGGALCVDHRCAGDLIDQIAKDGFDIPR
jgi:hypothetical protein